MDNLSNNTKKLLNDKFINKYISIKISKNKYFNNLKNKFVTIYKKYDKKIKYIECKKIDYKLPKEDSYFIGDTIKNKFDKLKNQYEIKYDNIELYIITNKEINKIKNELINKIKIISSLKELFNRTNVYRKITIYDVNEKKHLPKKDNDTIGPSHCNSGYCNVLYSNDKNGSIVLYRNEELIKVLIHESIHANFIDYNIIINQYKSNMNSKICTKYNILLNEAFTETFACLINTILVNYYTKINIDKIYSNEVNYMLKTFIKLMNYYNIKKIDDIIIKNGCRRYFKQNTNVFSYYVLKTLNYINIDNYLKIMDKYTNNFYSVKNDKFNKEYVTFVFKNIYNLDKYITNEKITNRNLRLSLYELKI